MKIGKYKFYFICMLTPQIDSNGIVDKFMPQSRYKNKKSISLNKYGSGPFCKFRIPKNFKLSGVYLILVNKRIKYIGECKNLTNRYNSGYGQISPRNCFVGGQETNVRINNLIYRNTTLGHTIKLLFYPTTNYKIIEKQLRALVKPKWNKV